jgi:hypothetical protein
MSTGILYPDSEMAVIVDDAVDVSTGQYANAMTINATLYDSTSTEVSGVAWPKTLTYVTSSDGRYVVTIPSIPAANLTVGATYTLTLVMTQNSATRAKIHKSLECRTRHD